MDYIIQTITSLFRKGQSNLIKIVCLAVGLSLGLILIAKVCFMDSINLFFPDTDRVYMIGESYKLPNDKEFNFLSYIPGGVAPGFAEEIPQIEMATRFTYISSSDNKLVIDNDKHLAATAIAADICIFDLLGTPVLIGDPKQILATPGRVMVSRSMAEKLGGIDATLGKKVRLENMSEDDCLTIDGIYEDIPETCSFTADAMASIKVMGEWSINNWMGNERYLSFVKLAPNSDMGEIMKSIQTVADKHVDTEALKEAGIEACFELISREKLLKSDTKLNSLRLLMLFLGIALIIISTLNYLLIVISTLVNRVKEIAVYKCYGASWRFLLGMTFRESAIHLSLALILGAIIILCCKDIAEQLLDATLSALFVRKTLIITFLICSVLMATTTVIPAYIFNKIPVAAAFRNFKESKKRWKLALLFVQFASTACIVGLLTTVTWQYNYIENADRGYDYDNLLVVNCIGVSADRQTTLMNELRKMPDVEYVSSCFDLPFSLSGNNAHKPNVQRELFNIGDFYNITDDYHKTMGVKIVDGAPFNRETDNTRTIMISKKFVERMHELGEWEGSAIGKELYISEHCNGLSDAYTVVGVYDDMLCERGGYLDMRPTVMFYDGADKADYSHPRYILIRMLNMNSESTRRINSFFRDNITSRECVAEPFKGLILQNLINERNMRDALIICTIIALIISLLGLYGYTMDEVNRRKREIAIRKVLGTSSLGIMRMISQDISWIAIPALLTGAALACYASVEMLKNYSIRIDPSMMLYLGIAVVIYVVIILCVATQLYRAANENPVNNLKAE